MKGSVIGVTEQEERARDEWLDEWLAEGARQTRATLERALTPERIEAGLAEVHAAASAPAGPSRP